MIGRDIRMRGMDGHEAGRRIRDLEKEGKGLRTPIIALTAGVMENIGFTSRASVFDDWVFKPFREGEVFEKLEKHLGVRFVYESDSSAEAERVREKTGLSAADLGQMPADWLKGFYETSKKGRSKKLLSMIEEIRPEHGDLAHRLAELVRVHQFDRLISLTQETLKEDSNG